MNHEWTRMDTNGHEKKAGGEYEPRMDTNGHEWNHEIQGWNHEKHEIHEKRREGGESMNHEWNHEIREWNHEKHEIHEKERNP